MAYNSKAFLINVVIGGQKAQGQSNVRLPHLLPQAGA